MNCERCKEIQRAGTRRFKCSDCGRKVCSKCCNRGKMMREGKRAEWAECRDCQSARNVYLTPNDPDAFLDMEKLEPQPEMGLVAECAQCRGYGGWHLKLNAYGGNGDPFRHFDCHCMNCDGWGWVRQEDAGHVHKWEWVRNTGRCLNLHRCDGCGKEWEIDSSD